MIKLEFSLFGFQLMLLWYGICSNYEICMNYLLFSWITWISRFFSYYDMMIMKLCMSNFNYDSNGLQFKDHTCFYSILMILNLILMYLCYVLIFHRMIMHVQDFSMRLWIWIWLWYGYKQIRVCLHRHVQVTVYCYG